MKSFYGPSDMRIANGLRSKKIAWLGTASYIANDLMKQSDFYCYKNNIIHTKTNQELCRKSRLPIRMRPIFWPNKDCRIASLAASKKRLAA